MNIDIVTKDDLERFKKELFEELQGLLSIRKKLQKLQKPGLKVLRYVNC